MSETTPPPAANSSASTPPPKKKRRLWLKLLLGLLVIVILLIALAPTIISMGFVKNIVVGQVNNYLNGKLEINDWSFGWTSGVKINGVKVYDASNAQVVEMKSFSTPVSFIGAARMNIALGDTVVDGLKIDAKFLPDGQLNLAELAKTSPSPSEPKPSAPPREPSANAPSKPAEPTKLPHVSGHLKLTNSSATVERDGHTLYLTSIDGDVNIVDLNQPIDHSLTIAMKVDDGQPGQFAVKGKAVAVKNDVVDLNAANADETVTLQTIELPALAPFIPPSVGVNVKSGVIDGQLALNVKDGKAASASGQINGKTIAIDGAALKGDTYATNAFAVAIAPINVNMPNGPNDLNAITIKADKPIAVTWDQGSVNVGIDLPLVGVLNLANNKAPGAAGTLQVGADVDLGKIAAMLPHVVHVRDGTTVTSGKFRQTVNLMLTDQAAGFLLTTDITDIAGKNNAADIKLQPINVKITGQVGESKTSLPGVKDVNLTLTSAFANANLTAPTLSQLKGQASGELAKVQSELGQLIDFGQLKMTGSFAANIDSSADPNDLTKPADINASASLTNLNITGLPDQASPVTEPWMGDTLHAQLVGLDKGVTAVKGVAVTAKTGQTNPSVDFAMTANVDLTNGLAADYTIQTCNVVLPQLQKELGPLVAALRTAPDLGLGTLAVASEGKVTQTIDKTDASKSTLDAKVSTLSVTESTGLLSVTQATPIEIKMVGSNITPVAKVQYTVDVAKVSDVVQKATAGKAAVTVNGQQQKISSGKLTGNIELTSPDAKTMKVAVDGSLDNLTLATTDGPSKPETITFGLAATPASDFSAINNTSFNLKSTFANVDVKNIAVSLPVAPTGAKGPALPVVKSGDWSVDIADTGPLQSLASALMPAADPNNPSITVPRGAINMKGNISHDGTNTVLTVASLTTKDLRLQQKGIAKVKDIDLGLVAKVDISGDTNQTLAEQLRQVSINFTSGNLGAAQLKTPTPITITNPLGTMNAAGQIVITGQIADVTTMLEALAGQDPGKLYPFTGAETLTENISTAGNTVTLKGNIDVADFKVMQNGQAVVNEPKVAITNDLGADLVGHNAKITAITLDMPASGALKANIVGNLTDWVTARKLDGFVIKYSGDWTKLWAIAKPLVPPANQAMVADLALSGQFDRTINLAGSYPASQPMNVAIKSLTADGSANIANVTWPSMGVTASNIDVPFTLKDGVASLVYAGKPAGQNAATPMTVNNGTVDLSGITVDLTQPDPRLNTHANYVLAKDISLNKVLASQIGKLSPLFFGADNAQGKFSATIVSCDKFPLSALATHTGAANDGTLNLMYSVDQLQIDGGMATVIGALTDSNSLRGDVKNATINIANGEVKQDTTLTLGQQGNLGIRLYGGVILSSLKLDNFLVNLPPSMLKQVDHNLIKYLPTGVDIALKGTIGGKMALDPGNSIKNMVGDAVKKAAVGNLFGGGKKDTAPAATNPTSQPAKQDSPIDDLKDLFGKKKKKK